MQLMVLLEAKYENIQDHLIKWLGNKYTSHDIQNELLEVMTHHVYVEKLKKLGKVFFSIVIVKHTDISNKEELSFCLRFVKENLEVQEAFINFLSAF